MIATYTAQIVATIRIAFADRTNFLLQMAGMAANNGFFFVLWILFFAGFRCAGGWQFADVCLLLGVIMTIVGVAGVFFGGYRDMATAILRGEADALLTQPKAVLPRLLARESFAHACGDLVTGMAMLATLAGLDAASVPLAILGVVLGLTVYISASVAFASLVFWIAGARSFARDLTDFLLLFSSYQARSIRERPSSSPSPYSQPVLSCLRQRNSCASRRPRISVSRQPQQLVMRALRCWYSTWGSDDTNAAERRRRALEFRAPSSASPRASRARGYNLRLCAAPGGAALRRDPLPPSPR